MTRAEVFAELKRRGVIYADVSFSGGNDEGHVHDISLFTSPETSIPLPRPIHGHYDQVTKTYVENPPTPDSLLWEGLSVPVFNAYGSFAGEYWVSGKVTWAVESQKVRLHGHESVEIDEPFDRSL